jgi:hypothetical protein
VEIKQESVYFQCRGVPESKIREIGNEAAIKPHGDTSVALTRGIGFYHELI